jgi:hypothetical protein
MVESLGWYNQRFYTDEVFWVGGLIEGWKGWVGGGMGGGMGGEVRARGEYRFMKLMKFKKKREKLCCLLLRRKMNFFYL